MNETALLVYIVLPILVNPIKACREVQVNRLQHINLRLTCDSISKMSHVS